MRNLFFKDIGLRKWRVRAAFEVENEDDFKGKKKLLVVFQGLAFHSLVCFFVFPGDSGDSICVFLLLLLSVAKRESAMQYMHHMQNSSYTCTSTWTPFFLVFLVSIKNTIRTCFHFSPLASFFSLCTRALQHFAHS